MVMLHYRAVTGFLTHKVYMIKANLSNVTSPPSISKFYVNACISQECRIIHSTMGKTSHNCQVHSIRSADTNPCFGCQQGRLLLLRAGRCLRSSTGQAAVYPQRAS